MALDTKAAKEKTILAFDLYGTILSTSSISKELSTLLGISDGKAEEVAILWRRYQLEYSWRLSSMKKSQTFSQVTLNSLHHALFELSIPLPATKASQETFNTSMLQSYNSLSPFPDALAGLKQLSSFPNLVPYIFSNGDSPMLHASVHESDGLKPYAKIFKTIVSVEETGLFKPGPEVYHHLVRSVLGLPAEHEVLIEEARKVWLVSSNPFDVVGAKAVGIRTAWVDRGGKGWMDRLLGDVEEGKPDLIVTGVDDAVKNVGSWDQR